MTDRRAFVWAWLTYLVMIPMISATGYCGWYSGIIENKIIKPLKQMAVDYDNKVKTTPTITNKRIVPTVAVTVVPTVRKNSTRVLPTPTKYDSAAWWNSQIEAQKQQAAQWEKERLLFQQQSQQKMDQAKLNSQNSMNAFDKQAQQSLIDFQKQVEEAQKQFLLEHGITP